ncbi:MAG: 4Fe-4S dicluster domain-containing protein [Candidatus Geothermarchaeales archaeon]
MSGDERVKLPSRRSFIKFLATLAGLFTFASLISELRYLSPPRVIPVSGRFQAELFAWAMEQPPTEPRGKWRRNWVMVIDLERCDGCGSCTIACKLEHEVPDGQEWIKVYEMKENPLQPPYFLPRPCMQCENAPCVKVCPVGATFYNEDGVVDIDKDRCIGCRLCMAACPYGARYFNWGAVSSSRRLPVEETNMLKHVVGTVEKCIWCDHRYQRNKLPACVLGCPHKAIFFGDVDEDAVTNGSETWKISEVFENRFSFRLLEELGTEPRVYYLAAARPRVSPPLSP